MKEGEPRRQKEHGEPFCTCLYCQDQKLGLHRVETIDGVTEWLCGRHKRRADLTGLASYDLREPTEKDKKLADYIRGIIVKVPAIVTNPASEEARQRLDEEKVSEWGWENLKTAEHRRQQIILVASHNQALVDVMDAYEEGQRGFTDRVESMRIDYAELSELEGWYETQDRNCQIMAYNQGLTVGQKALSMRPIFNGDEDRPSQ